MDEKLAMFIKITERYTAKCRILAKNEENMKGWIGKKKFFDKQKEFNHSIDLRKNAYLTGSQEGIIDFLNIILNTNRYPFPFIAEYEMEYRADTKILILDYLLPSPEQLPTLKEVKYVQSKHEYKEVHLNDVAVGKIYDDMIYKISLRLLSEIFDEDSSNHILSIVFNGWINSIS